MGGLRPFRQIPENIVEWTRWMKNQEVSGSVSTSTTTNVDGSVTTVVTSTTRWTIKDYDDSYTLQAGDELSVILRSTKGTAVNLTVPKGVFDKGSQVTSFQGGAGQVTIVADTGVTIRTPSTLTINEQYGSITLILIDDTADEWMIAGRMTPV